MDPLLSTLLMTVACGGSSCETTPFANGSLFAPAACVGPTCVGAGSPRTWKFIDDRHWVFAELPGYRTPEGSASCPGGDMIEIKGGMVNNRDPNIFGNGAIEYLQKRTCTKWITRNFPERCAEFDQSAWEKLRDRTVAAAGRKPMHYCIDPYEWPNRPGAAPWIMVTWPEAQAHCESRGKRLCSEDEWTFACEGEDALPYPYGYRRDPEKCNIDRPWIKYDDSVMLPRGTDRSGNEMARLWQGHVSGADPMCVSPFGVHDMTGNIDEWTVASHPGKYESILKGGYWGMVRTRCRPSTRNHSPDHTFYQQGFRCCADPSR